MANTRSKPSHEWAPPRARPRKTTTLSPRKEDEQRRVRAVPAHAREPGLRLAADLPAPRSRRAFGIDAITTGARTFPVSQADIARFPFCVLTGFTPQARVERRILVVPPLAGSFAFLLRDLVVGLLRSSELTITDWLDARHVPAGHGEFGFRDQVEYVATMIRMLGPDLDVIGVCQGGVPALIATAQISEEDIGIAPRSLILIGVPIDPLACQTRLVRAVRSHPLRWLEENMIEPVPSGYPGKSRLVFPASRQLTTALAYVGRHVANGGELFWKFVNDDGEDPIRFPFARLCLSLMDLPAKFFLENLGYIFHERALCAGAPSALGRRVDLRSIRRTALMTIEGGYDDISGPGQTHAAQILCNSVPAHRRAHLFVPGSGHFSLFYGKTWRKAVLPSIAAFWREAA